MRGVQTEVRRRKFVVERPSSERNGGGVVEAPAQVMPRVDVSRPVLTLPKINPKTETVTRHKAAPIEKRVDALAILGVDPFLIKYHREMEASYGFGLPLPLPNIALASTSGSDVSIEEVEESETGYSGKEVGHRVAMAMMDETGELSTSRLADIESLSWHLNQARGNVVVAGLGLGILVHALCMKDTVDRVIVIEPDALAFQLFRVSAMPFSWPGYQTKIQVVVGDPFAPEASAVVKTQLFGRRPDYLFASLWPEIPDEDAVGDIATLVKSFAPVAAGWWGQELEMAIWMESKGLRIDDDNMLRFFKEVGVPCRPSPGYVEFCIDVAKNAGYDVAP